jgi:hypothetical protein
MLLRQYLHTTPTIAASYVFGCASRRAGVVVDPVAEPAFYMKRAAELGLVATMLRDIPAPPPNAAAHRAANLGVQLVDV